MNTIASITNFGGPDLIVILLIVLVLFGAKRLPELARGMGQAMREFHKAKDDFTQELHTAGSNERPMPEVRPAPTLADARTVGGTPVEQPQPATAPREPQA